MNQPEPNQETRPTGSASSEVESGTDAARRILDSWRQRLLARELDVSPRFIAADITNAELLCRRLATRNRRIEVFVWSCIDDTVRKLVGRVAKRGTSDAAIRQPLAEALNQIIGAPSSEPQASGMNPAALWDKARFAGVQLSTETRTMLARLPGPGSAGPLQLHRLLLVDAFPTALRRVPQDTSRFIPHGTLFPSRDELDRFGTVLRELAVRAGLKGGNASALARIDARQPSLRLLDTLRLLIQRLALVPPNPRAQVIEAVQQDSAEAKRLVYRALCRLRDAGMNLDAEWHRDLNLEVLLGAGVSVNLADHLRALHAQLAKSKTLKGSQPVLARLINHAVFTDLFVRSTLWDRDYSAVREFCQWLRKLNEEDAQGFVQHLLAASPTTAKHLSFLHWERFTSTDELAQRAAARRKAENREQKKLRRIAEARSTGKKPNRRRRVVPQPEDTSLVFEGPDWILVL